MKKLFIIDKDNKLLFTMDETDEELEGQMVVDNSVQVVESNDCMVIKLKEDYGTHGNTKVQVIDGEIMFEVDN